MNRANDLPPTTTSPAPSQDSGAAPGREEACARIAERLRALEHGMRTPLGTLTAALELLKMPGEASGRDSALHVMERQLRQLTTQLEQLHDISRDLSGLAPPPSPPSAP